MSAPMINLAASIGSKFGRRDPTAMLESSVIGMREGGTREAHVSPHLAYREGTSDGRIPPNAVIRWHIELVRVEDGQERT